MDAETTALIGVVAAALIGGLATVAAAFLNGRARNPPPPAVPPVSLEKPDEVARLRRALHACRRRNREPCPHCGKTRGEP